MAAVNRFGAWDTPGVTRQDVLDACRGVHSLLSEDIKSLTGDLSRAEKSLGAKAFQEIEARVQSFTESYDAKALAVQREWEGRCLAERAEHSAHAKLLAQSHVAVIAALEKSFEERAASLEKTFAVAISQVQALLTSLPTPQVHVAVPEQGAPVVTVHPPEVHVVNHVPEQAPAPVSVINQMPELQCFNSVHLPEQAPPTVNVSLPEPKSRKTTKQIGYDDYGRPTTIEEFDSPS